ncbi:hypothetical protein DPEC_G00182860 [Dallia pectoralis]|uniref:Uncharacterized protein n=1 Tax=Dallia pectoralis TaxID=75939 RepID=A0ACC2GAJ8_DALPE|nr:hypothetical protein DPEC_G00182860 [Dallia pectoralis]
MSTLALLGDKRLPSAPHSQGSEVKGYPGINTHHRQSFHVQDNTAEHRDNTRCPESSPQHQDQCPRLDQSLAGNVRTERHSGRTDRGEAPRTWKLPEPEPLMDFYKLFAHTSEAGFFRNFIRENDYVRAM